MLKNFKSSRHEIVVSCTKFWQNQILDGHMSIIRTLAEAITNPVRWRTGFQIPGVCLQAFLFSSPPPLYFFFRSRLNFCLAKTSKSARKPHGNAYYTMKGYSRQNSSLNLLFELYRAGFRFPVLFKFCGIIN